MDSDRIIATNGVLELHAVDDVNGYVYNTQSGEQFDVHSIASIMSKGVWKPTRTTVTVRVEKGGAGSGHWGHAGRPGKIGGSVPGSVAMSIRTGPTAKARQAAAKNSINAHKKKLKELKEKPVKDATPEDLRNTTITREAEQYWNDQDVMCDLDDFVNQAYNYKDEKTGMFTEADSAYLGTTEQDERVLYVTGSVFTSDNKNVGSFQRYIYQNNDGQLEVHHDYFALNDNIQGSGFGRRFYRNCEETYLQAGIEKVTLDANLSVGGYAWARMGYNFSSEYGQTLLVGRYNEEVRAHGKVTLPLDIPAYKLAAAPGGKDFMLHKWWSAEKNIDPDDEGFLVGYQYMSSKD